MIAGYVFHIEEMCVFLILFINDPVFSKILDSREHMHTSVSSEIHVIFFKPTEFYICESIEFLPIITLN